MSAISSTSTSPDHQTSAPVPRISRPVEDAYIVRRCSRRECRLLALHPAELWLSPAGTPRVRVRCLKCGQVFGARVKRSEWRHFDKPA
jgi:hypothetical protein